MSLNITLRVHRNDAGATIDSMFNSGYRFRVETQTQIPFDFDLWDQIWSGVNRCL